ncbi:putative secreted protein [Enterobacter sp. J49]|uniref:hypothetical protein n=1 Tax=Enterobacter sp. J49 TaxID=1903627 RepID=UPI000A38C58E|nr:hypothetical protein [Enterobacter sp. J49]OUC37011.1 putative secreted protein [Enterobacter sp. J49]
MAMKKRMRTYLRVVKVSTLLLMLTGCVGKQSAGEPQTESARLQLCQKELEGLKTVVPKEYNNYRHDFDRLMQGAAQYSSLRAVVGGETRYTVDALYVYKVNLLCAGIGQRMLTGLAERGERTL